MREQGHPALEVERRPRMADAPPLQARVTLAQALPSSDAFSPTLPYEAMSSAADLPAADPSRNVIAQGRPPELIPQPHVAPQPIPAAEPAPAREPAGTPGPAGAHQSRPGGPRRDWVERPGSAPGASVVIAAPVDDAQSDHGATGPQLRRFIKSRAYVPMHELRRRFGINSHDDDVTPVDLEQRRVFVGLPDREGRLLADLLRGGDIGYELSMDPITPIVVGVYPMRPVTRP
jgi:hypothetical protein